MKKLVLVTLLAAVVAAVLLTACSESTPAGRGMAGEYFFENADRPGKVTGIGTRMDGACVVSVTYPAGKRCPVGETPVTCPHIK